MSAAPAGKRSGPGRSVVPERWVAINVAAPQLAATMLAYLDQIAVSQRPATVHAVETDLRIFAGFVVDHDPALAGAADIERSHIEAFKVWQHGQPGTTGTIKPSTFRRRIGMLRMFFVRIIEWDWPDAPARVPIFFGDIPKRDEPLPRFLDDADYVKFMGALSDEHRLHRRLAIELLARTGMRVGELWAISRPTRSPRSATRSGCGSRSASSTTTATSRCTRTWSSSLPPTAPPPPPTPMADCSAGRTGHWTATPCNAGSPRWQSGPGSVTFTHTGFGTRWRPRPCLSG